MREIKPGDKIKVIGLKNEGFADSFKEHVGKEYTVKDINCEYDGIEYTRLENCDFMPYLYNYELVDESKENEMTLGDLETGMRLITRDGSQFIVLKNVTSPCFENVDMFISIDGETYIENRDYTQDLLCEDDSEMDIVKIYAQNKGNFIMSNVLTCPIGEMDLIWERKENKPILTDKEKKYLTEVIRPFRDKIMGIVKLGNDTRQQYIKIIYDNGKTYENINLPFFEINTMYAGMEVDKLYSLKELGVIYEQ